MRARACAHELCVTPSSTRACPKIMSNAPHPQPLAQTHAPSPHQLSLPPQSSHWVGPGTVMKLGIRSAVFRLPGLKTHTCRVFLRVCLCVCLHATSHSLVQAKQGAPPTHPIRRQPPSVPFLTAPIVNVLPPPNNSRQQSVTFPSIR